VMYCNGEGVTQNYVRAHMWFNLAASNGDINAKENREILAKRMAPSQIASRPAPFRVLCPSRKYMLRPGARL